MGRTKIDELNAFGQSIWLDNISRSLIQTGKLKDLLGVGLRGITSNPSIFNKSISSGGDYDSAIKNLNPSGMPAFEIYDELTVKDIQDATDAFAAVHKQANGLDGYVSLEINPKLAFDAQKTIEEGRRLHKKVNRPNLMLKVPATKEGFPAIEELTALGMNVNATLIFSQQQYKDTAASYIKGLRRCAEKGGNLSNVRSVASVFVSRVDSAVDKMLEGKKPDLKGKAAVANCAVIYKDFKDIFSSSEFKALTGKGANAQRVLWASTSTKTPSYSDIKYVTELIARDTVNTLPQATFDAFLDHGNVSEALTHDAGAAEAVINDLGKLGINIDSVCDKLLKDGVDAFIKAFESLLANIEKKTGILCKT